MLTRVGFVWTAAFAPHLLKLEREQTPTAGSEGPFDVGWHDPGQELSGPAGLHRERFEHVAPVLIFQNVEPEFHLVGLFICALDAGMHPPAFKANGGHMTFSRVGPGPFQALFKAVGIDELHPLLNPPGLLGQTVVTDRGVDAAWWGDAHDWLSSRLTSSLSCPISRPPSQSSPEPMMSSASLDFSRIMRSIFSSTEPLVMNLCTITRFVWPMR